MTIKKKYIAIAGIGLMITAGVMVTAGVAANIAVDTQPGAQYKNLKVLPKNISSKDLSKIMVDDFGDGLGVSCNFCHAKENNSDRLDYASDAKPEKEMARSMMRMTLKLNKKFFHMPHPLIGSASMTITCVTCHNGLPHPGNE
jgi:hypothetical protein